MTVRRLMEVCVDSVESALAAQAGGADRIELCQALGEGGLTPSAGLLAAVREKIKIPIAVMIRPRAADFCYSPAEFDVMRRDVEFAKKAGADLLVFGVLDANGDIDRERTVELVSLARPLPVTFHRAFDMTRDPAAALETLIELGIERVLTSGQERSVMEGLEKIVALQQEARGRIIIMPGGGIKESNLPKIFAATNVQEFHVSASVNQESAMTFRNPRVMMGRLAAPAEYSWTRASEARVRAFRELAG